MVYIAEENNLEDFAPLQSHFQRGPERPQSGCTKVRTVAAWFAISRIATCCCPELANFYIRGTKKKKKRKEERKKQLFNHSC